MRGYERLSHVFKRLHDELETETVFLGYGLEIPRLYLNMNVSNDVLDIIQYGHTTAKINTAKIKTILHIHDKDDIDPLYIQSYTYDVGEDDGNIVLCIVLEDDSYFIIR